MYPVDREQRGIPSAVEYFGVKSAFDWYTKARPQVLKLLADKQYGQLPPRPENVVFRMMKERHGLAEGKVRCCDYQVTLFNAGREFRFPATVYLPERGEVKLAVAALTFWGLPRMDDEPERLPIGQLADAGIAVGFVCCSDVYLDRDLPEARKESIWRIYGEVDGRDRRYTAISAWAYAQQLLYDLLRSRPECRGCDIWAQGHSRLGKTTLWAVANDPRFAGAVSNQSGCGGAALYRGKQGEDIDKIVTRFPYWFVPELDQYRHREYELPWDQHWLIAAISPRPVLITSAAEDAWADPENEFRAAVAAGEVYKLFGVPGIDPGTAFPNVNTPVFTPGVGYYVRDGKHTVRHEDWKFFLDFVNFNCGD